MHASKVSSALAERELYLSKWITNSSWMFKINFCLKGTAPNFRVLLEILLDKLHVTHLKGYINKYSQRLFLKFLLEC